MYKDNGRSIHIASSTHTLHIHCYRILFFDKVSQLRLFTNRSKFKLEVWFYNHYYIATLDNASCNIPAILYPALDPKTFDLGSLTLNTNVGVSTF